MSEGRTFEEVDRMTIFDLEMIRGYRRRSPSLETLVRCIAVWSGAYKPQREDVEVLSTTPENRPPDPTADIRRAFAGARMPDMGDLTSVLR